MPALFPTRGEGIDDDVRNRTFVVVVAVINLSARVFKLTSREICRFFVTSARYKLYNCILYV